MDIKPSDKESNDQEKTADAESTLSTVSQIAAPLVEVGSNAIKSKAFVKSSSSQTKKSNSTPDSFLKGLLKTLPHLEELHQHIPLQEKLNMTKLYRGDVDQSELAFLGTGTQESTIIGAIKENLDEKIKNMFADQDFQRSLKDLKLQIENKDSISKIEIKRFILSTLKASSLAFDIPKDRSANIATISKEQANALGTDIEGGYLAGPDEYGFSTNTHKELYSHIILNKEYITPLMNSENSVDKRIEMLAKLANTIAHENTHHHQSLSIPKSEGIPPARKPTRESSADIADLSKLGIDLQNKLKSINATPVLQSLYKNQNHELFAYYVGDAIEAMIKSSFLPRTED